MFKKPLASIVSAAILVAGPGNLALTAAAQTMARGTIANVSVIPTIVTSFNNPVPSAASLMTPSLMTASLISPALPAAPSVAAAPAAAVQAAKAVPVTVTGSPLSVIRSQSADVGVAEKGAALDSLFENSMVAGRETLEVLGRSAASVESGLGRSEAVSALSPASISHAKKDRGPAGGKLSRIDSLKIRAAMGAAIAIIAALSFGTKIQELKHNIFSAHTGIEQAQKDKAAAGGRMTAGTVLGDVVKISGVGFSLISPFFSALAFALIGSVSLTVVPERGRWLARQLAAIGVSTAVIGAAAPLAIAKLGLAAGTLEIIKAIGAVGIFGSIGSLGAFGAGVSFAVPAAVALTAGVIAMIHARRRDGATVAVIAATPAGSALMAPKTSPGMLARRLLEQLGAAMPVYNDKVRNAATLVEKLRRQIAVEEALIAGFDRGITTLLADSDPANDYQAAGLLNSKAALAASVAASREQLALAEKVLGSVEGESARFFSEREKALINIQSGLTNARSAAIRKQLVELNAGFQAVGLDRFSGADVAAADSLRAQQIDDEFARRKAAVDLLLNKAKDSLRTPQITEELALRKAAINKEKGDAGGLFLDLGLGAAATLLVELGIGAAVLVMIAILLASFRKMLARTWALLHEPFSLGVNRVEKPAAIAQRILDQLSAAQPAYSLKVQEADALAGLLRLQIEKQEEQSSDLDRSVTSILSDSDPYNDVMAMALLNQKKALDDSTAMTREQLALSERALADIIGERTRFFSERDALLTKTRDKLNKARSTEIGRQLEELKGGF
jgi:hypothetical protein